MLHTSLLLLTVLLSASAGRIEAVPETPAGGVAGAAEITYFDVGRSIESGEKKIFDILWNAKGEIGKAANYEPIPFQFNKTNPAYSTCRVLDAEGKPVKNLPSGDGFDLLYGSHDEAVKSGVAHYFIAAYTMKDNPGADVWLLNANEWAHSADSADHLNLRVYVNDELKFTSNETQSVPHALHVFNAKLGKLKKGDVIYVAVGPGDKNARPQFRMCYTIATLPEGIEPKPPLNILYPAIDSPAPRRTGNGQPNPGYVQRADACNKNLREKNPQLVFIGDSITDGWDKGVLNENFGRWNPVNLGIFGDTIQNLHWRIKKSALAEVRPKLIVQLIGINNFGKYSVDEIIAGNAALVKTLREMTPETKILLMGLFPKGRTNQDLENNDKGIVPINEGLAKLADNQHVFFLNIRDQLLEPDGSISLKVFPDGLHPNKEGYIRWARAILPTVQKLMSQ